jgi:hypothetical protein
MIRRQPEALPRESNRHPRRSCHAFRLAGTDPIEVARDLRTHLSLGKDAPVPRAVQAAGMVEIEIGVLRGQCLDRRIGDRELLVAEIAAWERQRNAARAKIKWMFTTERARSKSARAYPKTGKES